MIKACLPRGGSGKQEVDKILFTVPKVSCLRRRGRCRARSKIMIVLCQPSHER